MTTPIIGVVAPYLSQEFLAAMMDEVHALAAAQDTQVILFEGPSTVAGASGLAQSHVSGWLLFINSDGYEHFTRNGVPVVGVSTAACAGACPVVLPDNWGGIQEVMQHLFDHGHQRIAFIGTMDNADIKQRCASYQAALEARGLPVDPRLIVDTRGYREAHGRDAIEQLLASGLPFSAVVTAGDFNAFGAVEALRNAGRCVPEDVAVTGFDDVFGAQFADPPLTTVRQRGETVGRLAATTLLRMIAGEPIAPTILYAPTALIRRASCGCGTTVAQLLPATPAQPAANWTAELAEQLALLARHPLPPDPTTPAALLWPGAASLAALLAALLQGGPLPEIAQLAPAWEEAVELTESLDALFACIGLLEAAGQAHQAATAAAGAAEGQLKLFLERNRQAMVRARIKRDAVSAADFAWNAYVSHEVDSALLYDDNPEALGLGWLDHTQAEWACLGLWDETQTNLNLAAVYRHGGEDGLALGGRYPARAFPPAELLFAPPPTGTRSNVVVLPVASATRTWGLIALRLPTAKQLTYDLRGLRSLGPRLAAKLDREALLGSLRQQQETLRQAYERERALADTIRELGCPVIPLLNQVLLVPLVGAIDTGRAQQIIEAVLDGIARHQATMILLDITGVPLVDTQVANSLLKTAHAAQLVGARAALVGVRPEIAQNIVGLGVDLRQLLTFPTLATALAASIRPGR